MKKTIGGDRLGSGKKMKVDLKHFNRSTHDMSYIWRSTMASGTLVPFLVEVALPGDTFDITLNTHMLTHPTIGPLFGSYKGQLDVFQCPIRLYQGKLHNNALGIGLKMSDVHLPQIKLEATNLKASDIEEGKNIDNFQINSSSIFSYLNIRGLGKHSVGSADMWRTFNAVPYIAYWDIYKNYYANKQEEIGAMIHAEPSEIIKTVESALVNTGGVGYTLEQEPIETNPPIVMNSNMDTIYFKYETDAPTNPESLTITWYSPELKKNVTSRVSDFFLSSWNDEANDRLVVTAPVRWYVNLISWGYADGVNEKDVEPKITTFPLENIDKMRDLLLKYASSNFPVEINKDNIEVPEAPYRLPLKKINQQWVKTYSQEGLALKTYQSDLFNNWMSTDWIDGENGINAITAIDTSEGSFTVDTLNLANKVYNMLNRIAISGGSYDDWLDAVYNHDRYKRCETPMYMGGLSKELVFQEVVSNSASEEQPLGTLAGRGTLNKKHKGGQITIKVDEPSYIIGLVSLTPRLDYSQGNKWDVNLKTMDDLHKPDLDQIGFQDLITDQMAWFETQNTGSKIQFKSAGKQPAWINYMTNVNQVRGNFAMDGNEMFMVLNRRYEPEVTTGDQVIIKDLTTYIDPVKFNHIFAETARDAQNFWVQIGVDMIARRKLSAKVMPNL